METEQVTEYAVKFLKNKGYKVTVKRIDTAEGALATFEAAYPASLVFEHKIEAFTRTYSIYEDHVVLVEEEILLPKFAQNIAVFNDIVSQAWRVGVPRDLIVADKDGEEVSFFEIGIPLDGEDKEKQIILAKLFTNPDVETVNKAKPFFRVYKILNGLQK